MSVKQEVISYLEKHPDTPLKELTNQMSDLNPSTVRRYYFEFKRDKAGPGVKTAKGAASSKKSPKKSGSLRQQIMTYLDEHPESDSGQLYQTFSKANRKTIRNYLHQWRLDRPKKTIVGKIEQKVFQYLDRHPQLNINELKSVFPDGGSKLITIFRNWKKGQAAVGKRLKDKAEKALSSVSDAVPQKQLVKSLKAVIEKQKTTIEQQRMRIKDLRTRLAKKPIASLSGITKIIKDSLRRPRK